MAQILPINELFDKITEANKNIGQGAVSLQKVYSEAAAVASGDAATQLDVGINNQIISSAKTASDLAIQQARIKSANVFGTNMKNAGEQISALAATVNTEYANRETALKKIEAKRSVSFFDNPLEYVVNQFTVNDDIQAHNTANERHEAASNQIATLNTLTQSTVQTQNMLDESITAGSIAANDKNIADAAKLKASVSSLQALTYNAESINSALNADKTILANSFTMFNAQKAEQQANIALEQLNFQRMKFNEEQAQKKLLKGSDDDLINSVNAGRIARLGAKADIITPGSVRANTVLSLLKSNSPAGQEFSQDYLSGQRTTSLGQVSLATSAANAVEVLDKFLVNLTPAQVPVKDLLASVYSEALSGKAMLSGSTTPLDVKNKIQFDEYINGRTKELLNQQAAKIVVGDSSNVFNIPAIDTLIKNSSQLQSNSAVQKFITPLIAAGVDVNNPKILFSAVTDAVQKNTLTYSEALSITQVFQTGVAVNQAARNFVGLGLSAGIKNSYNVPLKVSKYAFGNSEQIVNLADAGEFSRWLNKSLAAEAFIANRTEISVGKNLQAAYGRSMMLDEKN